MIWVPIVFGVFKFGVLGTTIFFAVKSHRDGEKAEQRQKEARAQQLAAANQPAAAPLPDLGADLSTGTGR